MKTFSKRPQPHERRRTVACPVCGGDVFRRYWDCGEFQFMRCKACEHLCQNPQPLSEDVQQRYDAEYFDYEQENDSTFLDLMLQGLHDVALDRWLYRLPKPLRVLDIGCATGTLLEYFEKQHGIAAEGVEICEPAARHGIEHRGVRIHVGTLEDARFAGGSFSLVHFSHLIEHLPDPRSFLHEVHRVAAPEGRIVVVTPDAAGLQARLFGSRWRSAIADHLHLFSRRGLARLLSETGFRICARVFWGGLARGSAPGWIKAPVDRAAKRFGFGDVMLFMAERAGVAEYPVA